MLHERRVSAAWERELCHCSVRGVSALHGRGVIPAATLRGRHVTAAWEGPCRGTFWVGGVTVGRNEEHCQLVNQGEANRKFCTM